MILKNRIFYPYWIAYLLVLWCLPALSQVTVEVNSGDPAFPFPQFLPYEAENGHKLDNLATVNAPGVTHAEMEKRIREAWQIMANGFTYTGDEHQGVKYIKSNIGCPYDCTEGVGYSMIAAAYMGDKTTFDGIWFREHDARMPHPRFIDGVNPYPNYKYGENTITEVGGDAATDGDVDFALGLLMAWRQWGENSGYTNSTGEIINYKEEALKVIRGLVERENQDLNPSGFDCRSVSGNVGFDGYFKNGNTWGELTEWASNDPVWCPEFKGPQDLHVDYVAPAYFHHFAKFLEDEGGEPEDIDWNLNQLLRAEASSDWLVGQHYQNSPASILSAGWVALDANNNATFSRFNEGEDFRFAWRTALNYMWNGNPETTWNPETHQVEPGANSFERDMAIRHARFLKDPGQAPWSNICVELGGGPELTYMGPSQLMWTYTPEGKDPSNGQGFPINWNSGTGSPSAVSAQDFELMGKLYHMCSIEWDIDGAGDGYLTSDPKYFHGFFRLLGLMILSGNHHGPYNYKLESNMKVYLDNDKTYAFTGDLVNFTIDYRNYASVDASGVQITTTLPEGLEFVSTTGGATVSGTTLTWNIGSVPGFKTSTGIGPTTGQVSFTARVASDFSGQICPVADITTSNGTGWTSNEYPNNVTAVMERNCIDIVEKALEIDKTVNYDTVNPGTEIIYNVEFENASSGGYINGGRPGVVPAYAHQGTAAEAAEHWIMFRLYHGAAEPYIDYQNYRLSLFLNDNINTCSVDSDPTCTSGWQLGNATIYEGGDKTAVRIFQEDIVPGSDARGAWNQRIVVQFSEQLATSTPHLSRYFGIVGQRVHQGGAEPLRAVWQMSSSTWSNIQWDDDWSWNPALQDVADGLYYPVANDWTDINNPDQPVTSWHNEACETATVFADNILVEEWDGYTWRRIYGSGPLPGRDVNNVIVKDVIPEGFTFVSFVDENGAEIGNTVTILGEDAQYDASTRTITWTKDRLQIKQSGIIRYKVIADFSSGTCNRADEIQTNTASIEGDNESPVLASVDVTITCDDIILPPPPSSMTKNSDKENYDEGESITYTLEYQNTNGTIANADLTSGANWTAQNGSKMNVSGGELTTVSNDPAVTTYNYSHGTNGTIEASVNFQGSAAFGFAFRHTGGAKSNGQYIIFKPNPGNGSTEIKLYNGTNQMGTTINAGFPNTLPATIKLELVDDQVNLWIGNTSNPTPTLTFTGFPVRAGYAGFVNGWADDGGDSYGTHRVVAYKTHLDSGFDLKISDPLPEGVTFVSASDNGVISNAVLEYPAIAGPVLKDEIITYTWNGTIETCPANGKIVNNAYTNLLGIPVNSIAAQNVVSCGGIVVCIPPGSVALSGTTTIREGESTTITATINPDETGWIYNWYKLPDTGTPITGSGLDITSISVSDSGQYIVQVQSPDDATCMTGSDTLHLQYAEECSLPDSVVVSGDLMIEDGSTTDLAATLYPAQSNLVYNWYKLPDLNPIDGSGVDESILSVSDTGKYLLEIINPAFEDCSLRADVVQVEYLCEKAVLNAYWNGSLVEAPYTLNLCEGESGVLAFAPQKYDFEYDLRQLFGSALWDGEPILAGDSAKITVSDSDAGSWFLSVYADPGNQGDQLCWDFTDATTVSINVTNNPTVDITAIDDSLYCQGENGVTLSTPSISGGDYTWYKDDVVQPDPIVANQFENATNGLWKVVAGSGNCIDSAQINVLELESPVAEFDMGGETYFSYCETATGLVLLAKEISTEPYTYHFHKNGLPDGVASIDPSHLADEGSWTVVLESPEGCRDTSEAITVEQTSSISVKILGDTTLCANETLQLSTSLGTSEVSWTLPDNSEQLSASLDLSSPSPGEYKVFYDDGLGCTGKDSVEVVIQDVENTPEVMISQTSASICQGDTLILDATYSNALMPSMSWYVNATVQNITSMTAEFTNLVDGDWVKVQLQSTGECLGTQIVEDSIQVEVSSNPIFSISSVSTSLCPGEETMLNSSGDILSGYSWYKNDVLYSNVSGSVSVNTAGLYFLKGISPAGCKGKSETIEISEIMMPAFEISSEYTSVCGGLSVLINSDISGSEYSYSWIDQNDTDLGVTTPSVEISQPGAYRMILQYQGCADTSNTWTIDETLLNTPVISGNTEPICEAEGEIYSVLSPQIGINYFWTVPEGASVSQIDLTTVSVNFADRNGSIEVVARNDQGCESEPGTLDIDLQFCDFRADIAFDQSPICPGGTIVFESISTGVTNETVYEWTFGPDATPSVYNGAGPVTVAFSSPGDVTASLTITDNGVSDQAEITGSNLIQSGPVLSSINGSDFICMNSSSTYSLFNTDLSQVYWSYSSNLEEVGNLGSSIDLKGVGSGAATISVYAESSAGCLSNTLSKSVNVGDIPDIAISTDRDFICVNETTTLSATGSSSYSWYLNGFKVENENGALLETSVPGYYQVAAGADDCLAISDSLLISVSNFNINAGPDRIINLGETLQLNAKSGYVVSSYNWEPGNYTGPGPVVSPEKTTVYTVYAVDENGCRDWDEVQVTVVLPFFIPNAFTPNGDGFHDTWEITGFEQYNNLKVEIYNRWGAVVYTSKGSFKPWNGKLDGVMLPVGTYYYVIEAGSERSPITGSILLSK